MPNHWTRYAAKTKRLEQIFEPKLIRVIKKFRKDFISDLQNHGESYARNQLNNTVYNEDLAPLVQAMYKTGGLTGAKLQYAELKPFEAEARRMLAARKEMKAANFGRNETWIRDVLDFLKLHLLEIVQDITSTMKEDILRILQKAVDGGWGIAETVKQLQSEGLIKARARTIARTEINNAANAGHKIAAASLPYEVDKGWSAANDHRTRHSHQRVNGQWIDENDLFKVAIYQGDKLIGYEEMDGPGDPKASAGNIINCRCRRLYRPKRDSKGRLILRNPNQAPVIPMRQIPRYTPEQIAAQLKSHITISVK